MASVVYYKGFPVYLSLFRPISTQFLRAVCFYKDIWNEVGCDVNYFYDLRNQWIKSFISELNEKFEYSIDENGVRFIKSI